MEISIHHYTENEAAEDYIAFWVDLSPDICKSPEYLNPPRDCSYEGLISLSLHE